MEKQMVEKLMFKKVEQCAKNDAFLVCNTDTSEELDFYSDTERLIEELTDKYNFTKEEVSRFYRHYGKIITMELAKLYNK